MSKVEGDDPADWRSTVDSASGRTYWYHRKTRVSTWTMPQCLMSLVENVTLENELEILESTTASQSNSFVDALLYDNNNQSTAICLDQFCEQDGEEYVNSLVDEVVSTKNVLVRRKALAVLSKKSTRCFNTNIFVKSQSWLNLCDQSFGWEDSESFLLLATLYCNLSIGCSTHQLLSSTDALSTLSRCLDRLFNLEGSKLNQIPIIDFSFFVKNSDHSVVDEDTEVLTERTIQSYVALISKGHALPAKTMLILIGAAFQVENSAVIFLQRGALVILHCICICQGQAQYLRDRARECLLWAMTESSHVRERVLDSFLDLSGGLSQIPSAHGPDPSVVGVVGDCNEEDEEESIKCLKVATSFGRFDVADLLEVDEQQRRQLASHTDVEWIPTSGTSWSLSSVLLWSRCPALRDLIGGFWEDGGGGLELSIRACDEVLSSLCRYIHTGMVLLPPSLDKRLQLLRVAAELEMSALYQAIRPALASVLNPQNLSGVLRFAEDNDLPDLQWLCDEFSRSGRAKIHEIRFGSPLPTVQLGSSKCSEVTSNALLDRSHRSSSGSLREAISASLQDVTDALADRHLFPHKGGQGPVHMYSDSPHEEFADITMEDILQQSDEVSFERFRDVTRGDSCLFVTAEEYSSEAVVQQVSPLKKQLNNKSRSGKSGGIYGLLLESQNESVMDAISVNQQVHKHKSHVTSKDIPLSTSASTPRTQRATRLLANAGPSVSVGFVSDVFDDGAVNVDDDELVYGATTSDDFDGATEFEGNMSLAPARKTTTSQQRLLDMAKPRKTPIAKRVTPLKGANRSDETVCDAISPTDQTEAIVKDQQKFSGINRKATSAVASTLSKGDHKLEPKRAVSPMSTGELHANSIKVKQSQSLSGSNFSLVLPTVTAEIPGVNDSPVDSARDPPLENVRCSLTLLKTRATRRRRSVAELEEASAVGKRDEDSQRLPIPIVAVDLTNHNNFDQKFESMAPKSAQPFSVAANKPEDSDGDNVRATCECPDCGRRFNAIPFEKHVKICAKVFLQKRKAFDSSKMRIDAIPELKERLGGENGVAQRKKGKKGIEVKGPSTVAVQGASGSKKWQDESNAFRNAMKAARAVQIAIATGGPMPPVIQSAPDLSLTQCPHCMRRFNEKAAERHIGHCQNIRAKPSSLKRGSGINASNGSSVPGNSTLAGNSNKSKKW